MITGGFEWHSEDPQIVNGCAGSSVTLRWRFRKQPHNSVGTIHWFRFARQTLASYVDGQITNPNRRFTPTGSDGDLRVSGLTVRDTGHYEVDVKIYSKDDQGQQVETVHSASAMLFVGDPPVISGDRLTVQEVTSNEGCALQRQVTLRCGHFTKRGVPPVEVVWTDPAGQQLPSSRHADGHFDLDLPRRPLAGNYTCHVLCQNPVLQCLPPDSPLRAAPSLHLGAPSRDGCSEGDGQDGVDQDSRPVSSSGAVERLVSNVTELQQSVVILQQEQTRLNNQNEERQDAFRIKVEELRELVLLANQQSSGAQFRVLQQTLLTLQNSLHDVQQNVTALQQGQGRRPENPQQGGAEPDPRFQDIQNNMEDLRAKLEQSHQKMQSLEEKVITLSVGLSLAHDSVSSLQDAMNGKVDGQIVSEHAQNVSNLWENLDRLEQLHADTLQEVRVVSQAQRSYERRQDNLTRSVNTVSSRVDGVEQGLGRRVDRAVRQCNLTKHELSRVSWRLQRVEKGQPISVAAVVEDNAGVEPGIDPLVSQTQPTFSLSAPWDGQSDSLLHDFLILPEGQVVIADRYHADVILVSNVSAANSDVTTIPLRYGTHVRKLTLLPDGLVAATVDHHFIFIFDPTADDPKAQQRWVRTSHPYRGIAARSTQTLFVGATAEDTGGVARVDVISIVDDAAVAVSTVLNGTVTSELQAPSGLTVHEDALYVCDWRSGNILRLELHTLRVTVIPGPGAQPELRFFQPRHTTFDVSGNMYVTTGGRMCGTDEVYASGFCVVVISQEGWWERLVIRGQHIYPYGLALTPTGLAVSWGSWVQSPTRSLIQWYDLVHPNV